MSVGVPRGSSILLKVEELTVAFATSSGTVFAPNELSFQIGAGEVMGLVGESGCGKSATCRSIVGLLPTSASIVSGSVMLDGVDLVPLSVRELRRFRGRDVGVVFQDPMTSLDPVVSVGDQIVEVLCSNSRYGRAAARQRAVELLNRVGIPGASQRFHSFPHELSGGLQQRVAIAIAISCGPQLLLADEPTTALDVSIQSQILSLLHELCREDEMGMVLVTHDLGVVSQWCDTVGVMYAGSLVEFGSVDDVFQTTMHPYARGLLEASLTLEPERRGQRIDAIPGDVPDLARLVEGCSFQPRCLLVQPGCESVDMRLAERAPQHSSACPFS